MTERNSHGTQADRYVEHVKATSTVYGAVGDLTEQEERRVREMYRNVRPSREAVREVLKMRGEWPGEPEPRKTYGVHQGARGLPRTDDFGRRRGRRGRGWRA
jgi:hypothetical protein